MGQKTPSSALRIPINREYDISWFKESKYYSDLFFKDFKYREYIESICSQVPNGIYFSRILSSAYPKKYDVHLFPHFQNQLKVKTGSSNSVNTLLTNKTSIPVVQSTSGNNSVNMNVDILLTKNQIFQDFLSYNLRCAQFSTLKNSSEIQYSGKKDIQSKDKLVSSHLVDLQTVNHTLTKCHTTISMLKTSNFESSAHFFNAILIESFKKSNSYRRAIKNCLLLAQKSPHIVGIRITCAGRFNGAERARIETRSWGQTSLQHLDSRVDYCSKAALTNAGLLGIKVWVSYAK